MTSFSFRKKSHKRSAKSRVNFIIHKVFICTYGSLAHKFAVSYVDAMFFVSDYSYVGSTYVYPVA